MRSTLTLLLLLTALPGCAYSIVRGERVQPAPLEEVAIAAASAWGAKERPKLQVRVVTAEEVPALLTAAFEREFGPGELERYQDALVAVGLWPPDRHVLEEVLAVSREEVAGFYVPSDRTLYAVGDVRRPLSLRVASSLARRDFTLEAVLAHEIIHQLQHESFPVLFDEVSHWKDQDDAVAALGAAIEGDATHYGLAAIMPRGRLPSVRSFRQQVEPDGDGALAAAPALIRLTLAFPYSYGYGLSRHEGRALLEAPPASTEQVLHPGRRDEPFWSFDLGRLAAGMPSGCTALAENTVGELGLSVLMRDLGGDVPASVWRGWDGDRFLAARCAGQRAFVWWTAWDSEADAAEFARAYRDIAPAVQARAGLAQPPAVEQRPGGRVLVSTPELAALAVGEPRARRVSTLDELRAFAAGRRRRADAGGAESDPSPILVEQPPREAPR